MERISKFNFPGKGEIGTEPKKSQGTVKRGEILQRENWKPWHPRIKVGRIVYIFFCDCTENI